MRFSYAGLLSFGFFVGCAASTTSNVEDTSGPGGAGQGGQGGATTSGMGGAGGASVASTSSGFGGGSFATVGSGGGAQGAALIYAHTDTSLFNVDPNSPNLALTSLGDFDCIPAQDMAMTDLAVSKSESVYGIGATGVYPLHIVQGAVHCGAKIPLTGAANVKFFALTFAPAGVLDPAKEVLVAGNTAGELWAVDTQGNLTQHGTFGKVPSNDGNGHSYQHAGKQWELSGDIVFVANKGNPVGFATVRDCPTPPSTANCNPVNTLIEIDVAKLSGATTGSVTKAVRGQIVKRSGCNDGIVGDYGNMFGIAAWNDKVYGFSRSGNVVEIDVNDGGACLVQGYPDDKFSGAGVTTLAPVQPPPPK